MENMIKIIVNYSQQIISMWREIIESIR